MFYELNNASISEIQKRTSLASLGKKKLFFFGSLHDGSGSSYCLSPGLRWLRCAPPCRPQDSRASAAAFGGEKIRITFTSHVLDSHEPRKSLIYVKKNRKKVFSEFYKIYEN